MKELEKTKNISVAAVLTILAIIVALLSFKKPKYNYTQNTASTLEQIVTANYLISESSIEKNSKIIDVRDRFEFAKGAIKNAINIPSAELFNSKNEEVLNQLKKDHSQIVLYAKNAKETLPVFMLLKQLGFKKVVILNSNVQFLNNQLVITPTQVENPVTNITAFINESVKKTEKLKNQKPKIIRQIKKITPLNPTTKKKVKKKRKKRKMPVEGGC